MKTHYFLAAVLPEAAKDALYAFRQQYREELPFQSWVHRDDYHITLVFLGDVTEPMLHMVKKQMEQLTEYKSFSLTLEGLGVFGVPNRPRILWAGMSHAPELFLIQQRVRGFCEELGFSLEARPYRPHITIARRWKGEQPLSQLQEKSLKALSFPIEKIALYQTHLDRAPKYEELFSILLSNA